MNTDEITEKIIGCAFTVSNVLGSGFLEKVYENALVHDLRKNGLEVKQQQAIIIKYDNVVVGEYVADLLVENQILVELKACKALEDIHFAQCINYLKATGLRICLLLNFGTPKIQVKRIIV
jgi:GxxExxY protein